MYNLSYTWSFSTEQSVFVSSFPSLSYQHHLHARTRNKFSVLWKKCHISLQDGLWKIPSWSTHDLSLRNTACLFLHFLLYHISMQEQEKIFSSMKKVPYLLQDGLRNIPSWSILWTNQEDQTCITWVVHGLSLRNKVCLSLHFLLYHISMQEQENFFLFYEKNLYLYAGQTLKNLVLVNFMNYTRRSNVFNLSFCWSFSTEQSVFVSSFPSLSYLLSIKR